MSLSRLLESAGFRTQSYRTAEEFLDQLTDNAAGCVVTDLKLTGMSGLQLQKSLNRIRCQLPVIIVTGCADVSLAVQVMEHGAMTLIQKPYDHKQLIDAIKRALASNARIRRQAGFIAEVRQRLSSLTEKEQQVLQMVIDGKPNKAIATSLNISMRTVDRRRNAVFEKMHVQTAPELARILAIVEQAGQAADRFDMTSD